MLETILGVVATAVFGVIVWAFNLSSKVAVAEANYTSLKELMDSKFEDVIGRLERIERKMNGHLR